MKGSRYRGLHAKVGRSYRYRERVRNRYFPISRPDLAGLGNAAMGVDVMLILRVFGMGIFYVVTGENEML